MHKLFQIFLYCIKLLNIEFIAYNLVSLPLIVDKNCPWTFKMTSNYTKFKRNDRRIITFVVLSLTMMKATFFVQLSDI